MRDFYFLLSDVSQLENVHNEDLGLAGERFCNSFAKFEVGIRVDTIVA
jgi:hypothetical protein